MEIKIEKLDNMGRGISYINGKVVFVPKTLPGDIVDIEITKDSPKYSEGKLKKIIKSSDIRIDSNCPYFDICGGCNLLNLKYEDTIKYKKTKIKEIFKKYLNIKLTGLSAVKSNNKTAYRNKITLHIKDKVVGLCGEDNEVFEMNNCLLVSNKVNNIIKLIKYLEIENGSVLIRESQTGNFVISISSSNDIDVSILKVDGIIGILVNDKLVYGKDHFIEKINGFKFKVSYKSFFQINSDITHKLFKIISDNIDGGKTLDLFCGVGTLGMVASNNSKKVIGIDNYASNVEDARENKDINGINNIEFELGDSSVFTNYIEKVDTIILDPPRAGLNKETINNIKKALPNKIIYVSCDPFTLVRDLKELFNEYKMTKTYILDMFPYTHHIETVVILEIKL